MYLFNFSPWFEACFDFSCVEHIIYNASLLLVFQHFKISFYEAKRVNQGYVNFQDIQHQVQENINHFHHYRFL